MSVANDHPVFMQPHGILAQKVTSKRNATLRAVPPTTLAFGRQLNEGSSRHDVELGRGRAEQAPASLGKVLKPVDGPSLARHWFSSDHIAPMRGNMAMLEERNGPKTWDRYKVVD